MKKFQLLFTVIMAVVLLFTGCCDDESTNSKKSEIEYGTVTDIDGNTYKTVKIEDQWWMAENLNVSCYRNGDPIRHCETAEEWKDANSKQEGAWCYYDNSSANGTTFGKLYNWHAVNAPRDLNSEGWHVPTYDEWKELQNILGGSHVAGGKLKSIGTKEGGDGLWIRPNTGATNESGFSAFPGGWCYYWGDFACIGSYGRWWSSSETSATDAWYMNLTSHNANFYMYNDHKGTGFSIRCVRD